MHTDKRIIGELGSFLVHGNVHEVQLRDRSLHRLQAVSRNGIPDQFLRALHVDIGRQVIIFDVRKLVPALGADLPPSPTRDKPGLVAYRCRQSFADKLQLRVAIVHAAEAIGEPTPVEIEAEAA